MMNLPTTARLLIAALVAPLSLSLAAPASTGEQRESLDGAWQFTTDPAVAGGQGGQWDTMTVPGNWDMQPGYAKYRGKAWYRRDFTVPADWKGRQVRLRFGAVYHEAGVTLNGRQLGTHVGGYTPFEYDITGAVNYGGTNTLTVQADNSYSRGAWWPWGGISRSVTLIANNDARIVWQHIRSEPDLVAGTAAIFIRYKLANSGKSPLAVSLSSVIDGTSLAPIVTRATIPPGGETFVEVRATLPKKDVRLWHFDHPELYTLSTTLTANGRPLHAQTDRFGIRKIAVSRDGLYLNGEKIRVAGFNRVSDSRATGNTEPDALVRTDVDLMKNAGAVFSRLSHTPLAENFLDALDEKGMLIFAEIPVWGDGDPQVKKADNPLTKQWLREMIEEDYNHPCIIGWSPGNELTKHYDYVAAMADYIRRDLDPHRLVAYVSFTAYKDGYGPSNDPVTVSDLALINTYANGGKGEIFAQRVDKMRERWPDKAIFFSEYGSRQIGGSLKAQIPHLAEIWENITRNPAVIGGSLWTLNDYRSGMQGTPASGNREWGVVTVDRKPKAAYWQIRSLYSPVHSLRVENGSAVIQPRSPNESPSYTLRGYAVEWQTFDATGRAIAGGKIPLPVMAPGSATWSAPIPGAADAASIGVSLVAPTGYRVADATNKPTDAASPSASEPADTAEKPAGSADQTGDAAQPAL